MTNKEEKEFTIGSVPFKKYKITDIFRIDHGVRQTKNDRVKGDIPLLTAKDSNNGVAEYISNPLKLFEGNTITINMFGKCFYQSDKYSADDNIYVLENQDFTQNQLLYMTTVLNKSLSNLYSYNKQFRMKELKRVEIDLPYNKETGELNTDYMELYIKKVEQMYIKKVDAYLKTMGYQNAEDCLLRKEEEEFMKGSVPFKKYKITDIFHIGHGVRQTKNDRVKGDIPLLTAKDSNNGVAEYISNPLKLFEGNTVTINMFGKCFYQSDQYSADDNIYVLENQEFTQNQLLYITTILNKSLSNLYSYGKQFRMKELIKVEIDLPYNKETGELNTDYMEEYIEIIKKMIIKNLRSYIDDQLNALKAIISFKEYNEKS